MCMEVALWAEEWEPWGPSELFHLDLEAFRSHTLRTVCFQDTLHNLIQWSFFGSSATGTPRKPLTAYFSRYLLCIYHCANKV